ncbi:MAG: DUF3649 domain-containing protein [Candidatus Andeanibacterium colombiense]|uniref:DUF3649 domain-containing protein n=1 Tax=Candidatus Andeanibacterium colombiense TaxID=3121345 RepID=A0AAJ6BM26_9SPHN|nr:MAG: DUF3649 domain-containing protein [Sphingomonadaceae bacterium]
MSRKSVAARVAAAVLGGYVLAAAAVIFLTAALVPLLGKVDAVWLGTMPGALVYAAGIMLAFATRTAWRAWVWLLGIALVLGALRLVLG